MPQSCGDVQLHLTGSTLAVTTFENLALAALCAFACGIGLVVGRAVNARLQRPPVDRESKDTETSAAVRGATAALGGMVARVLVTTCLLGAIVLTAYLWVDGEADAARWYAGLWAAGFYMVLCTMEAVWLSRRVKRKTTDTESQV